MQVSDDVTIFTGIEAARLRIEEGWRASVDGNLAATLLKL